MKTSNSEFENFQLRFENFQLEISKLPTRDLKILTWDLKIFQSKHLKTHMLKIKKIIRKNVKGKTKKKTWKSKRKKNRSGGGQLARAGMRAPISHPSLSGENQKHIKKKNKKNSERSIRPSLKYNREPQLHSKSRLQEPTRRHNPAQPTTTLLVSLYSRENWHLAMFGMGFRWNATFEYGFVIMPLSNEANLL